ncbi:MAG: exodeoxyribonuclease VII large subunit [Bacteroidia bacterium]
MSDALSVSQFNQLVKSLLENAPFLRQVRLHGEIAQINRQSSGHIYFTLRDSESQLPCVMWRLQADRLNFTPRTGMRVVLSGGIGVYLPRGTYQLTVHSMEEEGVGDLYREFIRRKNRLEAEGLFEAALKRPIPRFPDWVGVVTSAEGAVIHDIRKTIARRFPATQIRLAPSKVQGSEALPELISALETLDRDPHIQVIILARGGGSLEDLWNFNEEALVRCVAGLETPVISAIGHERDFTLCDFVADLRAPTPTAAAEQVCPDQLDIRQWLDEQLLAAEQKAKNRIRREKQIVSDWAIRLREILRARIRLASSELQALQRQADALHPKSILDRGFSMTLHEGKRLRRVSDVCHGNELQTILADGSIDSHVERVQQKK